jgi:cyclopropane-fatty-acyl-phospholipid synthase
MRPASVRLWRLVAWLLLRQIRVGSLTIVENGRRRVFGSGHPTATIDVHSAVFWRILMRGSRGLAESFSQGVWDSPDLVAVIRLAARNAVLIDRVRALTAPVWAPPQRLRALLQRRTRQRSRRDIAAHYDLGNELFARMLDPTMMYSCALFDRKARAGLRAARAGASRSCPGDRDRLGRIRDSRCQHPGMPRHDHDDLPGAVRLRRGTPPPCRAQRQGDRTDA